MRVDLALAGSYGFSWVCTSHLKGLISPEDTDQLADGAILRVQDCQTKDSQMTNSESPLRRLACKCLARTSKEQHCGLVETKDVLATGCSR